MGGDCGGVARTEGTRMQEEGGRAGNSTTLFRLPKRPVHVLLCDFRPLGLGGSQMIPEPDLLIL